MERAGVHRVLVYSGGNPGSTASVSVNGQRLLMYLLPQLFLFSDVSERLCSFSWSGDTGRAEFISTADKHSSDQFIDQRREKLSSLNVSLLSPSLSDPPPHLVM